MSDHRLSLPFWEGFLVSSLVVGGHLQVRLVADPTCPLICSHCGAEAPCLHETTWRIVRDLPIAGLPVFLSVAVNRLRCRTCNRCCTQLITWSTVVLDADTRRVIWACEGRSREAIRPFFIWLGPERCRRVRAVAMDMNTAFDLEVKRHCRRAKVVYDLFHVIAKYGREVIDRVRVDEANRLREDKAGRQYVKRARWLLLRNRANVPPDQVPKLVDLLQANQALMTVYVLKASLKELWQPTDPWSWRAAWRTWQTMARSGAIEPLVRFARRLALYWRGILARMRWPMHTGQLEGINNRIKVMKRMAYGYRDSEFFFLKIKAAFPGNP